MENQNSNRVIGENPNDSVNNDVQQNYDDTCAIKSQQLVLDDFGIHVTEDQLVQQAEQYNIYAPGSGTSPQDVGKLLELNGVHCTQHTDASIYDLTSALAQGEKVIIGVDSGELWNNDKISDTLTGEQADHALIVAGIDTSDPNNVQVILTDPGTGQEGARYPIDQFLDAWHDSGNFMVTTNAPAPLEYNPEMINFDYDAGHIPMIGQMPYEYFDQNILPLSHETLPDPHAVEMLHDDFTGMMGGEIHSFSPELLTALEHTPFAESHDINIGMNHFHTIHHPTDEASFGNNMSEYYTDLAKQHEKLAQTDLDHGDHISAQNNLKYADDFHNHAQQELDNDNS
jgi:hypothetical protein